MSTAFPSKKQIQKAGSVLRKYIRGEIPHQDPKVERAIKTINDFRAFHQEPLDQVVRQLQILFPHIPEKSSRLKRFQSIITKLQFQKTLSLDRMQDIAGCRIVTQSLEELYDVKRRIEANFNVKDQKDYITTPKSSGYRGVHIVVNYSYQENNFPVELQLRTNLMHQWAVLVEQIASRIEYDLKRGDGPEGILNALSEISIILSRQESSTALTTADEEKIQMLLHQITEFLQTKLTKGD